MRGPPAPPVLPTIERERGAEKNIFFGTSVFAAPEGVFLRMLTASVFAITPMGVQVSPRKTEQISDHQKA